MTGTSPHEEIYTTDSYYFRVSERAFLNNIGWLYGAPMAVFFWMLAKAPKSGVNAGRVVASPQQIASGIQKTRGAALNGLAALIAKGWIVRESSGDGWSQTAWRIQRFKGRGSFTRKRPGVDLHGSTPLISSDHPPDLHRSTPRSAQITPRSAQIRALKGSRADNQKDSRKLPLNYHEKATEQVREIEGYYREKINEHSRASMTGIRTVIRRDLDRGYTVEQQKLIIDTLRTSAHHNGQNDRGKTYLLPDQIWRKDLSRMDWWLARTDGQLQSAARPGNGSSYHPDISTVTTPPPKILPGSCDCEKPWTGQNCRLTIDTCGRCMRRVPKERLYV